MPSSIAVMQPYFAPYIGYFQLIANVDKFVLLDDVNYIKRGWINRNRILHNSGEAKYVTLPLVSQSQNKLIKDMQISQHENWSNKILMLIFHSYKKAPFFDQVYPIIESIITFNTTSLNDFIRHSIKLILNYIGVTTIIESSSQDYPNKELTGQERIIDIVKRANGQDYINAPGGKDLYNCSAFANENINLRFIDPNLFHYQQGTKEFVSGLSIFDVMMFNSPQRIEIELKR